jgi:hypothetical protein
MEKQVVSKQRVADHGEVYTGAREVSAMLELVKHETENIEATFLEPACGHGNFLTEVLRRKLAVVNRRYRRSPTEFELHAVVAVGSLYGIDIQEDNVLKCRQRLTEIVEQAYGDLFRQQFFRTIRYVLGRNIVWGDALTYKTKGTPEEYIVFSRWSPINSCKIKRRDFTFHSIVGFAGHKGEPLFADIREEMYELDPVRQFLDRRATLRQIRHYPGRSCLHRIHGPANGGCRR